MARRADELDLHLGRRFHIERTTAQRARLPKPLRTLRPRGVATQGGAPASQPVLVKVETPTPRASGIRPGYLTTGAGREGADAVLYGPGSADPQRFYHALQQDHHRFTLVVMFDDHPGLDRTRFIEEYMAIVAHDLGTRLEWMAANHYNTAHPHTHIVLRAVDDQGEGFYMKKSYFKMGLRERAQAWLTKYLGTTRANDRTLQRQREQTRVVQEQLIRARAGVATRLDGMVAGPGDPDLVVQKQRQQSGYGHEGMAAHMPRLAEELARREQARLAQERERDPRHGYGR
jgi:type IV secretory pathway VirD2 relaxase